MSSWDDSESGFWKYGHRRAHGTSLIETPFSLWIIIFGLIMPMICLGTIGMRYTFFLNAARQAAHAATQSKTFRTDFPPDLSAQTTAQQTATNCCKAFSGVQLNAVSTEIVETPVKGGQANVYSGALANAADEENNLYQLRVQLTGALAPLMPIPSGILGINVPGLTAPYPITTSAEEVCENTQGLNR